MQQLQDLTLTHDLDKRCKQIEDALLIATQLNQPTNVQQNMHNHNDRLFDLTRQRQQLPPNARTERKSISKSIQKEIKAIRRMEQRSKIDAIIRQYRGLKKISGIKSSKDKDLITNMTNDSGKDVTKRQSIADVFATFYERLYTEQMQPNDADHTDNDDETHHDDDDTSVIDDFSDEELQTAITQLRSGRCKDKSGIMAEMIKTGGEPIRRHLLLLYNDIKRPHAQPPTQWKQTTITVIYKAGDPKLPQNYRPIAIIPLLYKLFSRLIYNRLEAQLNEHQCSDQAGFRHNFCTEDHLYTLTMIQEKSYEWQLGLWTATIDFKKAFDTVSHKQLWRTLRQQGVSPPYVQLLRALYADSTATVQTDRRSRPFSLQRGVKQGDPLSSLLFNAVLEELFASIKHKWSHKSFGIQLGHTPKTRLTNTRFADDVLLFATTLPQLQQMLTDLKREAAKYGLELHPDKTKILTNLSQRRGRNASQTTDIDGEKVEILHHHHNTKYLGRRFSYDQYHDTELDNRIATAWRKFNVLRHELTDKSYPLSSRLRLFDGTVTPTVMYGSAAWTLTKDMSMKLRRTQRRMLRLVVGTTRRRERPKQMDKKHDGSTMSTMCNTHGDEDTFDVSMLMTTPENDVLEPWQDFLRRSNQIAETHARRSGIEEWTTRYLRKKWRWASRIAGHSRDRWTKLATSWEPEFDERRCAIRHHARPRRRWDHEIGAYLQHNEVHKQTHWMHLAQDTDKWHATESKFIEWMLTGDA